MLSQYTWGQFIVFALVLLVIYYTVVGLLYYRDELAALLKGRKLVGPQLAGGSAGPTAANPPALVRSRSAFVTTPTGTDAAAGTADATVEASEDGAADNLPEAAAAVVGGELPNSTATATGRDDSTDGEGPMDAAASVAGATDEAVALDADREEQADQPNEALAAIIRQKAREPQPGQAPAGSGEGEEEKGIDVTEKNNSEGAKIATISSSVHVNIIEPEIVYQTAEATSYEPLASFDEPIAMPSDVVTLEDDDLYEVQSVADYILQVKAGENLAVPMALTGTNLAEQLAQLTSANTDELAELFGNDSE